MTAITEVTHVEQKALPETMRAVVCRGPEDYVLQTVPVPATTAEELMIRVEAVGICASDLKCYHGAAKFWGGENRAQWAQNDIIPGHEITGTVIAGESGALYAHGVNVGQRIVVEQIVPCGDCLYCSRGQYWMCEPHAMFGFNTYNGGMAEYMVIPKNALVHRISSEIKPAHAAFAEPLACSLHAVERANISFNDTVVVAGCGPIGLGMIAGARAKNPMRIIALDASDAKLDLARKSGADMTFNITDTEVVSEIKKLTGGYGADVYLEGTGHPSAVLQGLNLLRKLGTYVEYSVFGSDVSVDWSIISDDKELDVLGAHLGPHCWPAAIKLIEEGKLPLDEICTNSVSLEQFAEGIAMVGDSAGASVKVSIIPTQAS